MNRNIDDEVQFHIDEAVDALIEKGWTPEAARAEAERRFGNRMRYRRKLTAMTIAGAFRESVRLDWRDALRSLRAAPVITAAAILSLALGIGANTALFSIVNGLLLKRLPVHEPERLAIFEGDGWTNPIWERLRDQHGALVAGSAAWANQTFDLAEAGESEMVDGLHVSGSFLDVMGVRAELGRTLATTDDVRGGGSNGPVAMISHALWQRRFRGDPSVVGRSFTINRLPFVIVGVLPATFFGPEVGRAPDVYLPLSSEALLRGPETRLDERSAWWLNIIIRLKRDQAREDAEAALNGAREDIRATTIPERLLTRRSEFLSAPFSLVDASTGQSALRTRFASPLVIVTMIVAGVLLIACANVANLMLARASARRQELSVRLALGASRGRIARQMLAEALLLSAVGTAIGLWLSQWASALLVRQMSSSASVIALDLSMDWRVLAVTAAIGIITTIFFALAPVAGFAGVDPSQALGSAVRGTVSDRRATVRNALVIVQVALSLILVVAAGLFVRTFHGLASMPLGFAPENLLIVSVDASRSPVSQEALPGLYQRAAEAAATVPGVRSASSSLITPMSGRGWNNRVGMPDGSEPPRDRMTFENAVGPEWFTTYGMRILAGRALTPLDGSGSPRVAVVNEMFAKRFLADAPPVGARVTVGQPPSAKTYEVVGVVNDAVYRSARRGVVPTMYHPLEQAGTLNTSFSVTLDVPGDRRALGPGLRDALRKVDPALAFSVRPYSDQIGGAIAQERLVALLSGVFGTLALLLAAIGLYGVTAYAVSRRTRELAMRMALGASRSDVMRLVLRNVTVVVGTGAAIGIAFSLWASGFVTAMLFGIQPRDPITLVTAATVLVMTGLLAGWLPARRASRLDPNAVLRR